MLKIGSLLFIGFICTACIKITPANNSRLRYELQAHTAKFINNNIAPERIKISHYRKSAYDHFWKAIVQDVEYSCSENWRNCGNLYCTMKAPPTVPTASKFISNKTQALKQPLESIDAIAGVSPKTTSASVSMIVMENKGKLRKTPSK